MKEHGSEESPHFVVVPHYVGVFGSEFLEHVLTGSQEVVVVQGFPESEGPGYSDDIHEYIDHGDEEDEGEKRERGAESELQHVEERLLPRIHLVVLRSLPS